MPRIPGDGSLGPCVSPLGTIRPEHLALGLMECPPGGHRVGTGVTVVRPLFLGKLFSIWANTMGRCKDLQALALPGAGPPGTQPPGTQPGVEQTDGRLGLVG